MVRNQPLTESIRGRRGQSSGWSREMIGSDEFPFNDPFLDPKSRGEEGKGRRARHNPPRFPRHRHRASYFCSAIRGRFTRRWKRRYIYRFLVLETFHSRGYSPFWVKSLRGRRGRKGETSGSYPRFFASFVSRRILCTTTRFQTRGTLTRCWSSLRIPFARRPRFRFGFARLVGDSILTLRRNLDGLSSKLERNEREDLEMNGFWIWVFNFWKRWKIFVRGGMYRLCDIRILPMEWRDIYERT